MLDILKSKTAKLALAAAVSVCGCSADTKVQNRPPRISPNCEDSTTRVGQTPCGFNGEGFFEQICQNGEWMDNSSSCTGTDVCKNESEESQACNTSGTQVRTCTEGQWGDWGECLIGGCTDNEALNFNANATQDDGSCRYARSSDIFLDYAKTHYIPGRFPASACDNINAHHECVSTEGCNWLRTIKNNGVCREDPVTRCLKSGECVCRPHDFHGDASHDNDLELFVPLSLTWANLAPRTSAFGGNSSLYSTHIDMAEIVNESLANFTSRTDFSLKTLSIRPTSPNSTNALSQSNSMNIALKFMHVWDKDPAEMSGVLFDGLGLQVTLENDQLYLEANGSKTPITGETAFSGLIKDYQCNQLIVSVSGNDSAKVYLGDTETTVSGLNMANVQSYLNNLNSNDDVVQVGPINAKIWDLKVFGNNRQLSARERRELGKRCSNAGSYPIPEGYPDSNRRYSWGMGGYDIVLNHETQSYSSGVYVTMRIPEPDVFPPINENDKQNLKRMIGFWDRWQEQMFFEMDLIPFIDTRQLSPADSLNTYRKFSERDNLGEGISGSQEPANFKNPCRYMTDLFQGFNWLPEDFPNEPTSADHRKIAERGGWTRWDSHNPDQYGSWQRPVHEHGHTAHFTLMRTYRKVHHYIRGISGESFAEVMSNYVLTGLKSWMNNALTYYPNIPLAFEGRWDPSQEKHIFKSSQPYQEKNIDDLGLGARFYGLGTWWYYVSHYAAKPYLIGWISGDNDETPGTTLQKTRFYLSQEGLDFGELFGNFAAHVATWDLPYTGHHFHAQEQAPFQGIESWCTRNSGPDCTVDSLKIQADVDPTVGTEEEWVDGPTGMNPGGFAYNMIRLKDVAPGSLYEISLEFDVPSKIYADEEFHIRMTPQCKNDPRLFSSRIVVAETGAAGKATRAKRPEYYKIPGRSVNNFVIETPSDQTSDIFLLPIPTPPFELEDVRPFVSGYSITWPYKYKIKKLAELPTGANTQTPIILENDEMLSLSPVVGNGFTHDCFNAQ